MAERDGERAALLVTVVRSGGFAGLRRQWVAEPPAAQADDWRSLIEQCPWDDIATDDAARDRFVWSITVRWEARTAAASDPGERRATLPDRDLTGPWRTLVDRVRDSDGGAP